MEHSAAVTTGHFLKQVLTSLSENLSLQSLDTTVISSHINPQNIDQIVEIQMRRIQENCVRKEQQYVEQMLEENPIEIERRISATVVGKDIGNAIPQPSEQQRLQQQRAEACRRSRYNNKIRKAKSKYRHKYMSQKLLQSTQMYDCIQDLIAQAESHLLAQELNKDELHQLRRNYGMNKTRDCVINMDDIMKKELS